MSFSSNKSFIATASNAVYSSYCTSPYRYAFNGMEKDDELKGEGNSYDFGARLYDSRLGRWLTIDPLASKYPNVSTYNFSLNNPVLYKDPNGEFVIFSNRESVDRGKKWLVELGIDDEFRINKNGVLKKRWTPFKKNDDLTKSIKNSAFFNNARKALELSFSESNNWSVGWVEVESDVYYHSSSGSASLYPSIMAGAFQRNNYKLKIVVITKEQTKTMCDVNMDSKAKSEASEFIQGIAGKEAGNLAREKLGLAPNDDGEGLKFISNNNLTRTGPKPLDPVNTSDENGNRELSIPDVGNLIDYTHFRFRRGGEVNNRSGDNSNISTDRDKGGYKVIK